jgi:hypothetical protein
LLFKNGLKNYRCNVVMISSIEVNIVHIIII